MPVNTFGAEVVELPALRLYGRCISTNYADASTDCPALWHEFAKDVRLDVLSYGISIMTGPASFDYMAAVELKSGESIPAGMQEFALPAGAYMKCKCPSIEQLGEVFTFMYEGGWARENTDYQLDFEKPCFEGYTEEYLKSGSLDVYAPLKRK